jgi:formylglycine-generating enzyme required for sulfatase activity
MGDAMRGGWFVLAMSLVAGPAVAQQTFRDCPSCPEMVTIPAGSFTMGVPRGEEEREDVAEPSRGNSVPQHRVTIRSFALGRHEVTRAQFEAFVTATGRSMGSSCFTYTAGRGFDYTPDRTWRNPGFAQTPNDPVVCVAWDDAQAYAAWLSSTTGKRYRLPSEAEWEYAARAGSATARYWGDGRDGACTHANAADQALAGHYNLDRKSERVFRCPDGYAHTAPAGLFRANAFGLSDMLGNVLEWVEDCWNAHYNGAPTDGSAWVNRECSLRVVRGGSWSSAPRDVRAGYRQRGERIVRTSDVGFRVARDD